MRETRPSGSEGGARFQPLFLPLSHPKRRRGQVGRVAPRAPLGRDDDARFRRNKASFRNAARAGARALPVLFLDTFS